MTLQDIEKHIKDTVPIIKLKYFECKNRNYATFISRLINEYTYEYCTIDANTNLTTTPRKCHRSLGDIYMLTLYYFPQTTLLEVITRLFELLNNKKIFILYCGNIYKLTFFKIKGRGYTNTFESLQIYGDMRISKDLNCSYSQLMKIYEEEINRI
jgi:hypothetical protein